MKIADGVFLVGSGKFGFQTSHLLDCNIYLLDCGGEYALFDAGSGLEPERIVKIAEDDGIDFSKVTHLLLTHAHGDHAAGASYFHRKYGLKVITAREAAPWLETGDMEKTSLKAAIEAGVYPVDFQFPACPVHRSVVDGEVISIGKTQLQVLETPGHCRGHLGFVLENNAGRSIFSGDTVFMGGRVVIQNIWDCSIPDYSRTMDKLNGLNIDRLFAGHSSFIVNEAWRNIETAHRIFSKLGIPPNL